MCINGLRFTERCLYLFPLFLKTYPLKGYWAKVFFQNTLTMMFLGELWTKSSNTEQLNFSTIYLCNLWNTFLLIPFFAILILQISVFVVTITTMITEKLSTLLMVILKTIMYEKNSAESRVMLSSDKRKRDTDHRARKQVVERTRSWLEDSMI